MKKKIINGILLVALIFAASSAFVSCKDNDSDVKTELKGEITALQNRIKALEDKVAGIKSCDCPADLKARIDALEDALGKIKLSDYVRWDELPAELQRLVANYYTKGEVDELLKGIKTDGLSEDEVKKLIKDALEGYAKLSDIPDTYTKKEIEDLISDEVAKLEEKINAIYSTMVTSLNIDGIKNPLFGIVSAPIDVTSNVLVACYGKADAPVEFPVGSGSYIADAGDILTLGEGNAGTLYVTVNPNSVDFSGKTLTLENTAGQKAVVTLSPLEPSKEVLQFGYTRGANAFYETKATISKEDLDDVAVILSKADLVDLKDDITALIQKRTKRNAAEVLKDLYSMYTYNRMDAYRLKATWGDNNSTFSEAKIAALALTPLSYSFMANPDVTDTAMDELEKLEDKITAQFVGNSPTTATATATTEDGEKIEVEVDNADNIQKAIDKFWGVFNKYAEWGLDHVNYFLQPCLLVREGNKMSRAKYHYSGDITLVMTSRTDEIFAPAYKKCLIIKCDGEVIKNEVYDGSVREVPFTVEPGKEYNIEYQAVDFTGVTRVRKPTIWGK